MKKILLLSQNKSENSQLFKKDVSTGFSVKKVSSLEDAFSLVETGLEFDAIIVEVQKFDDSALEIGKAFKDNLKTKDKPLIIASHEPIEDSISNSMAGGLNELVQLPCNDQAIMDKIDALLGKSIKTLMLVDDDQYILELLKDLFEMEEYRVLTASDGEKALGIMKEERVDAVVSDIIMPGISGKDLLISVKKSYKNIPVVLITGYGGQCTYEDAMSHGADGYLTKPFKNATLSKTVRDILAKSQN